MIMMKNLLQRMILYKNFKRNTALLSIGLYLISLFHNCYCSYRECESGLGLLLTGWMGLYMGGPVLAWLANPFLLIAWCTVDRYNYASLVFSLMAVLAAVSFLFFNEVYDPLMEFMNTITNYKPGYWLWLASCVVMLIANVLVFARTKNINTIWLTGIVLIIAAIALIAGLSRRKKIAFLSAGYEVDYTFRGNLDTTDFAYKKCILKSILLNCNSYIHKKDTLTANDIINDYHQFGKPLSKEKLDGKSYPTIDTIIKYKYSVFDTTELKHQ
jgi:uncharacterized membrane protein